MNENDIREDHEFISRLRKVFPNEILLEMQKQTDDFLEKIRANKPKTTVSNTMMQKVLKQFPKMRANQIDDFLLSQGIGDEQALDEYVKLLKLNAENKPKVDGEGKDVN